MNFQHVSGDFAATIAAQVKAGKTLHQIARDMHMSVEAVSAALRKWSWVTRSTPNQPS